MKVDVGHIAHLARIALSEREREKFSIQISSIFEYVGKLNELDTAGVEPASDVMKLNNVMREDDLRPSLPKEEALMNAPESTGDFYRVLRIIE